MRFVLVDQGGNIVNVVEWDGVSAWTPPVGTQAIQSMLGGIGWQWNNGNPVNPSPPPPPPPPPPILTVDQKLALIGLTALDIQGAIVEAQDKSPVAIPDPNTATAS
jgi:hypothetical protein